MKEDIYYCFRYKCKNCPKQKKCEKELRGDIDEHSRNNRTNNNRVIRIRNIYSSRKQR